jgi:predicted translin family RNA/ssDNA-binding protein
MKGLLELENISLDKTNHNLKDLYQIIKEHEAHYTPSLLRVLKKHIYNASSYNPFFEDNKISVNQFYLGLKYPQSKDGSKEYNYASIRGKQEQTLKIYLAMEDAINELKEEMQKWRQGNNAKQ